jgi:integrase/recombinase XerC
MRLILAIGFAIAALLCWSTAASAADLTGHASISTTQRYTDVDAAHLLEVYDKAHTGARLRP